MAKQAEVRGLSSIWSRLTGVNTGSESSIRTAPSQAAQRSTRNKTATASSTDPQSIQTQAVVSKLRQAVPKKQVLPPDDSVGGVVNSPSSPSRTVDILKSAFLGKWASDYDKLSSDLIRLADQVGVDSSVSREIQNEMISDLQRFKANLKI